jgi:hypothetical protein
MIAKSAGNMSRNGSRHHALQVGKTLWNTAREHAREQVALEAITRYGKAGDRQIRMDTF